MVKPIKLQRHHYIPEFYLKAWCLIDKKKFFLYRREPDGKLSIVLKPPRSIGFIYGLYTIKPEIYPFHTQHSDEVEKRFFSSIDNQASLILPKLINHGVGALSSEERLDWALFINSLIERRPEKIRKLVRHTSNASNKILHDLKTVTPQEDHPANYFFQNANFENLNYDAALNIMMNLISDENMLGYLYNMNWVLVKIKHNANEHYVTGDNPILINGGPYQENDPILVISFALSPSCLLIMHQQSDEFDEMFCRVLAICHSFKVTEQTQKYLVSSKKLDDYGSIKYLKMLEYYFVTNKADSQY